MVSAASRRKARFTAVGLDDAKSRFALFNASCHRLCDIAQVARDSDTNAPYWKVTIDPPFSVENCLPFSLNARLKGVRMGPDSPRTFGTVDDVLDSDAVDLCDSWNLPSGATKQCLLVDPSGDCHASWSQAFEGIGVVGQVRLPFVVEQPEQPLRCTTGIAPILYGLHQEVQHGRGDDNEEDGSFMVPVNETDVCFRVKITTVFEDIDWDHQHQHGHREIQEGRDDESDPGAEGDHEAEGGPGMVETHPSAWQPQAIAPFRVNISVPVLVLNWSGLDLAFRGSVAGRSKGAGTPRGMVSPVSPTSSYSMGSADANRVLSSRATQAFKIRDLGPETNLAKMRMLSPVGDVMSIGLQEASSDWSRQFALAVGMSGEVTIPSRRGGTVHQVGVQVRTGLGKYVRTKVVTVTPRFVVVNECADVVAVRQHGAKSDSWQFQLEPWSLAPFHPVDVNGDGALDDKDFAVCVGIFGDQGDGRFQRAVTGFFRLDIVKRNVLKTWSSPSAHDVPIVACDPANCLSSVMIGPVDEYSQGAQTAPLLANVELLDNAVRVRIRRLTEGDPVDYQVDNLSLFVRVGVTQVGTEARSMTIVEPEQTRATFLWTETAGSRKVDVALELIGLAPVNGFPRRAHRCTAQVDFDKVDEAVHLNLANLRVVLRVAVKGLTKVLIIDDLEDVRKHNKARTHLQGHLKDCRDRLEVARESLGRGLRGFDFRVSANGGDASTPGPGHGAAWWQSTSPAERDSNPAWVVCEIEPFCGVLDAYGFTVNGLSNHPRRWRLYGRKAVSLAEPSPREVGGNPHQTDFILLDDHSVDRWETRDLEFHVLNQESEERAARTVFRLSKCFPACSAFKLEIFGSFRVANVAVFKSSSAPSASAQLAHQHNARARGNDLPITSTSSGTPVNHSAGGVFGCLWVAVVEARDLPVMDIFSSDPYAVLEYGGNKAQTKVVTKSLEPIFDEEVFFVQDASAGVLSVTMFDRDFLSKDDFMGRVTIEIGQQEPLLRGDPVDIWVSLESDDSARSYRGQVRLAMRMLDRVPQDQTPGLMLKSLRFPVAHHEELQIMRRIRQKLLREGGVLHRRQTSVARGPSLNHVSADATEVSVDQERCENLLSVEPDVELSMTILDASGLFQPRDVYPEAHVAKPSSVSEMYCVVTFGERSLRTDPAPANLRAQSDSGSVGRRLEIRRAWREPVAVVFQEQGPLGLQFERSDGLDGAPRGIYVRCVAVGSAAARVLGEGGVRIRPGAKLVGIQNSEITEAWSIPALRNLLRTSPRPLVMRFMDAGLPQSVPGPGHKLPTSAGLTDVSWMQQFSFGVEDTLRARAKEQSGVPGTALEGRRARISVFARDAKNEPSLDLERAQDDEKSLLVPLLYMFGDDVEVDQRIRANEEKFGERDVKLGEATVLLPSPDSAGIQGESGRRRIEVPLTLRHLLGAGQLRIEVGWTRAEKSASERIISAVDLRFMGASASLLDTAVRKRELALFSVKNIHGYLGNHRDGRQVIDAVVGLIQVDNQLANAVHPIILFAAPTPLPWIAEEDNCKDSEFVRKEAFRYAEGTSRPNPSMLVTLVKRNVGGTSMTFVEYFEFYLQEINVRVEERWLTAVQEFASTLSSNLPSQRLDMSSSDSRETGAEVFSDDDNHADEAASQFPLRIDIDNYGTAGSTADLGADEVWRPFTDVDPLSWIKELQNAEAAVLEQENRLLIQHADVKPVKINLTFSMTSDAEMRAENGLKILNLMQGLPILSALASALINTVANLTDAPLRFNALQISNEAMSQAMLVETFEQHVAGQLLGNFAQMGNILASADLLGSPVQLIGSFGKGAYSFFYEPALAMSQGGYAYVGSGLRKGGSKLVQSTLNAGAYTLEKFSEAVGRGLCQASLDPRFIVRQARRRNDVVNEPINVVEGVMFGARALGSGVVDGIAGIVGQPYRGYQRRGTSGLFVGAGRGILGAVVKPVCAFIDASTLLLKGTRNSTEITSTRQLPVRLPRVLRAGMSVQAFSAREAIGIHVLELNRLSDNNTYLYHEYVFVLHNPLLAAGLFSTGDETTPRDTRQANVESPLDDSLPGYAALLLITDHLVLCMDVQSTKVWWSLPLALVSVSTSDVVVDVALKGPECTVHIPRSRLSSRAAWWPMSGRASAAVSQATSSFTRRAASLPPSHAGSELEEPLLQRDQDTAAASSSFGAFSDHVQVTCSMGYQVQCRTRSDACRLSQMIEWAKTGFPCRAQALSWDANRALETSKLALSDPFGALEQSRVIQEHMCDILRHSVDHDVVSIFTGRSSRSKRGTRLRETCRQVSGQDSVTTATYLYRIQGMQIRKAVITNRRVRPHDSKRNHGGSFVAYRVVVASAETEDCWVVWRRYSEFRQLRNQLMAQAEKSRTALPIPSRHPWQLSTKGLNQRQLGLNGMLRTIIDDPVLRENPLVTRFFTKEAEVLGLSWDDLLSSHSH
ncbi:Putative vacuolar protein sorting-associated protein 13C (Developmental gene 1038 protein) [Durusdinium trenchii]|uniref:Vacuolar protein sorting-associated protein 13C (Developmental gene 1038 protein) n=1 Tax=Durusdinium trenchii TaxID=1381693 RepID=A0ABP0S293_9DINO